MRSLNTLNSIDNNENIVWDKGTYSLITETRSYDIASNVSPDLCGEPIWNSSSSRNVHKKRNYFAASENSY